MKKLIKNLKVKGMTLTELLVVLAILGVLMLLAIPGFQSVMQDAHSKEAELNLSHICKQQKAYFLKSAKYASDLKSALVDENKLVTEENGTAHYKLEIISADNGNFLARATAVTDFDADGQFNVWEIDKNCIPKEIVED